VRRQMRSVRWTSVVLLAGAVVVLASWGNSTTVQEIANHLKRGSISPLPAPRALKHFGPTAFAGEGSWHAVGRPVDGTRAIYETTMVPPGGTEVAGVAWMDMRLLAARLYSGSLSPGKGPYRFTAPVLPAYARTLVAAFNGGFMIKAAHGGYYTEGRLVDPLRTGAASFVIYANGGVDIGAWGSDVSMTSRVVSVRQNLVPLVADGHLTAAAISAKWRAWGATCGVYSCAKTVPGIEHQWRSGVGITSNGALVYVTGPALSPFQLAQLLVRARVLRGMELDINSSWPDFSTYDPPVANGFASSSNGSKLIPSTVLGPWTFFKASWTRDFFTMSARSLGRKT